MILFVKRVSCNKFFSSLIKQKPSVYYLNNSKKMLMNKLQLIKT